MTDTDLQFPRVIDNTMRSAFVSCPRKFYYSHIRHKTKGRTSIHLHAGGAFASALETFRLDYYGRGLDAETSLLNGLRVLMREYGWDDERDHDPEHRDHPKSFENMARAFIAYWEIFNPRTDFLKPYTLEDGQPAVECSSVLPLDAKHPETGEPLLYSTRYDMLAVHTRYDNALFVEDDKTATSLGAQWSKSWTLRSQFTGYCWSAQQHGRPVAGAIIRGISPQANDVKHAEAIVYRPQWMIDQWYEQLHRDIDRMLDCWRNERWDLNLADACTAFGGCEFLDLCSSRYPERIMGMYNERVWDPTNPSASDS